MTLPIDLSGIKFSRWTVIRAVERDAHRHWSYECRCECGAVSRVTRPNLIAGISKSCGCLKRESIHKTHFRHGRNGSNPTYGSWNAMRARCFVVTNPKYPRYGGRGITICERWSDFNNFVADMGERPAGKTLDRINNDGNYEPGNCRWATPKEQRNNQGRALQAV